MRSVFLKIFGQTVRLKVDCAISLLLIFVPMVTGVVGVSSAQTSSTIAELHSSFATPPDSSRIMMRWWWFGPAATNTEITHELEQMKSAGIGGVEIANLYPLELDDPASGFHNTPYLSEEHLAALRFAAQEARQLGLRVDITLGSGWPFGGPHIPVTEAAGKLRVEIAEVPAAATSRTRHHTSMWVSSGLPHFSCRRQQRRTIWPTREPIGCAG